jgi:hypothetical protein
MPSVYIPMIFKAIYFSFLNISKISFGEEEKRHQAEQEYVTSGTSSHELETPSFSLLVRLSQY